MYPTPGFRVGIHESCICNELLALRNRHLVRTKFRVKWPIWNQYSRETERFFPSDIIDPLSYSQVINHYSGNKRRTYVRALEDLKRHGLEGRDFKISMFIKPDKAALEKIKTKAPRAIQFRSPKYNLVAMRYLRPIEEWCYENLKYGVVSDTRVIAKGLDQCKRARLLLEKASWFRKPKYICLDHATFDATITVEHLKSTHRKYLKLCPSGLLRFVLSKQINNSGRTRNGIRYRVRGTRMSGDPDTGLGNSIINCDAIYAWLNRCGITKYDILLDGDDAVVIVEDDEALDMNGFEDLGFDTKLEIVDDIGQVEFCQSRIVQIPNPRFVRNPERAVSHYSVCVKTYTDHWQWLKAVGICEEHTNGDMPIYHALAKAAQRSPKRALFDESTTYRMQMHTELREPTGDVRLAFERAWGLTPDVQTAIEQQITCSLEGLWNYRGEFGYVPAVTKARWSQSGCPGSSGSGWWSGCKSNGGPGLQLGDPAHGTASPSSDATDRRTEECPPATPKSTRGARGTWR